MKAFVLDLIEKKRNRYLDDYSEMLGDYNRELETIKGYNGRQLLELLQNCDDEGATEVTIVLNESEGTISIKNNGETSFSEKGYRSLFIANLSSKTSKRKYIGNKGLGFRSIINWSNKIEIQSNGLSLLYSEENTKRSYFELFTHEERKRLALEENIGNSTVPMPFLSMPILKDIELGDFKTSIIIHYKEKAVEGILKQVSNITSETLLFLKHLEKVKFLGFENVNDIVCERVKIKTTSSIFSPNESIKFINSSWSVFEEEKELPIEYQDIATNETEYYQIKIAVDDEFRKSSPYLYSFFPTSIKLDQPYVLHATFDLDPTRNQLNDTDKNRFILERIVAFTIEVAKFYTRNNVSYKPLSILNHSTTAGNLQDLGYYKSIERAIRTEALFPCVDNTYKKLDEVIYVNEEFAELLEELNESDCIKFHLRPFRDNPLAKYNQNRVNWRLESIANPAESLNRIFAKPMTLDQRARFIRVVTGIAAFMKVKYKNSLNFLVNQENAIINGGEYIYTPITREISLKTPDFTNIHFINKRLFDLLLEELKFSQSNITSKGRFLYDQLKGFCNIHSYEPAILSQKIIRETNKAIDDDNSKTKNFIQEMNRCLYHNFKLMKDDTQIPDESIKVPTITKSNEIAWTEDLVLSDAYPTGRKTSLIFNDIYTDNNFVASPLILGLDITENDDLHEIERYLKWIRVNSYGLYRAKVATDGIENYVSYVQAYDGFSKKTSYTIDYKDIDGLEWILEKISIEKLVLWIYYDEVLKNQLHDNTNSDSFKYQYNKLYTISRKPSYIKFIISDVYIYDFSEFLIDEKYAWVNNFKIDYKEILDYDSNLSKTIINEILLSLGANDDFKDLPIERVAEIINTLPEYYPTGLKSQTFYKKALRHYNENEQEIIGPLNLFAHNGKELKLYRQDQIYFSEKIKLPNKLKEIFPILNYPARAGGAEAIKFFGINDLKEVKILIENNVIMHELTQEFQLSMEALKPFFLCSRLNVIEDVNLRKLQASICKKIEIVICEEIEYSVNGENFEVSDYEFLHSHEQMYFIKVQKYDNLNVLKRNPNFTDSIADIISLAFDITSDKNEFKYILRGDFKNINKSIKIDFGVDTLNDARELLGLADYKQAFWQAVFLAIDLTYEELLDDLELEKQLFQELGVTFDSNSLDYENINSENEILKIELLFGELNIDLEVFAQNYPYDISLESSHLSTIKDAILSRKNLIKSSIWFMLRDREIEDKAYFLDNINRFEEYHVFCKEKAASLKHKFKIVKQEIFDEFKNLLYPDLELNQSVSPEAIQQKNKNSFDYDELYEISQSERLKSLLYFEDAVDTIKQELDQLRLDDAGFIENTIEAVGTIVIEANVLSSNLLKPNKRKSTKSGKKVYTPKEQSSKGLKQKGNTAEQIVYEHLIGLGYANVDLISEDNEGLQCDIRYTNENEVVKYVEVKAFDNGNFHLSRSQYDFGFNNSSDYEIWLVKNLKDIFTICDFFSNAKYRDSISVKEYIIHLDIEDE